VSTNSIEELYEKIKNDVRNNLSDIDKEMKESYDKFNNEFKEKHGITYDDYYEVLTKFYEEE
jgi:gas vesicle protein